jgi:hypothetical protein
MGLESALFGMQWLENAVKRKLIGLESTLSGMRGLENALEKKHRYG